MSKDTMKAMLLLAIFTNFSLLRVAAVETVRGVAISKQSLYNPNKPFTCLDGSATIPIERVNDDYCDCRDGSDEPGTSACPNGLYHCTNAGYLPKYVPSSRVNDGICDCCDGTDEFSGVTRCDNTCKELGKALQEERERKRSLLVEGNKVYKDYSQQGEAAKGVNKAKLETLQKELDEMQAQKDDLERLKTEAETPEKEAKENHEKAWEARKAEIAQEKEDAKVEAAFKDLDRNGDELVAVDEMKTHLEFDVDANDDVSDEEAKEYLSGKEHVDFDSFKLEIWPNIKEIYQAPGSESATDTPVVPPTTDEPPPPPPVTDDEYDEGIDEDDEDDLMEEAKEGIPEPVTGDEEQMPEYDEETKILVAAADQARANYNEIETKYNDIKNQIRDVESLTTLDFGEASEFYPLKSQCFEFTDREYTYKLCPFERMTQRPKNGGSETNLGTWGHWSGPEHDKYSAMKYEHGTSCWNGPDRSADVKMHCGLENALSSATEPSRCEYEFHFNTPALCKTVALEEDIPKSDHDEL